MYYLRMQGRVTGPFTIDKLKALRARGILQPFHECSSDRSNWQAASSITELFPQPTSEPIPSTANPAAMAQPQVAQGPTWFYLDSRKERCGPVGEDVLPFMVEHGEFNKKTLVWTSGMAEWSPASTIFPSLFNRNSTPFENSNRLGSFSRLAWALQGRALILLTWPFFAILPTLLLLGILAATVPDSPWSGIGTPGFKVGVVFQYLLFLAQAGFAVFGAFELLRLGKTGAPLLTFAGYSEIAATTILFAIYSSFTVILLLGWFRDSPTGPSMTLGFLTLAIYTLGQSLAAASLLIRDIGLANQAFSENHWVGRHFFGLAAIAGFMTLNTLIVGVIGIAVLSDDGGTLIEKLQGMAFFGVAFLISYGIGKWFEFHHSLLTLPIASSMRNTM